MNKEWQQQAVLPEVTPAGSHGDPRAGSALSVGCTPTGPEHSGRSYRLTAVSIIRLPTWQSIHQLQNTSTGSHQGHQDMGQRQSSKIDSISKASICGTTAHSIRMRTIQVPGLETGTPIMYPRQCLEAQG